MKAFCGSLKDRLKDKVQHARSGLIRVSRIQPGPSNMSAKRAETVPCPHKMAWPKSGADEDAPVRIFLKRARSYALKPAQLSQQLPAPEPPRLSQLDQPGGSAAR
jgi:hypothetical protein